MTQPIHPAYTFTHVDKKGIAWGRISANFREVARMAKFLELDPDDVVHKILISEKLLAQINKGKPTKIIA